MNPYWINPQPDTDEWLHSDRVKKQFVLLVAGHVVLWIVAFCGIIFLFVNAQTTAPIEAFTASGEPAWGTPMPLGTHDTIAKQEEFLNRHLKNVFQALFMRTEKGTLPALVDYTDPSLMAIMDRNFNFVKDKKGGYSQAFYIDEFERISDANGGRRRIYRIKGTLSAHSLDGSSNTPIYLLAAVDRRQSSHANPMGWVVSVIIAVDAKEFYNKERQELIDEVTRPRTEVQDAKRDNQKSVK